MRRILNMEVRLCADFSTLTALNMEVRLHPSPKPEIHCFNNVSEMLFMASKESYTYSYIHPQLLCQDVSSSFDAVEAVGQNERCCGKRSFYSLGTTSVYNFNFKFFPKVV